ncbi:hypothetical protein P691DRAFT_659633, partial [Macrolepiota fuliginosa MF-IS2]
CLVAFLVSEMFITTSHVAGHSSGFSGSLVHSLVKHLHALRLVLIRNTAVHLLYRHPISECL